MPQPALDQTALTWPESRLDEALDAIVRAAGIGSRGQATSRGPRLPASAPDDPERAIPRLAVRVSLEASRIEFAYADIEAVLSMAGPALLPLRDETGQTTWLAIVRSTSHTIKVVAPSGEQRLVASALVAVWIRRAVEQPIDGAVNEVLRETEMRGSRYWRARSAVLGAQLGSVIVGHCWLLQPAPAVGLWQQIKHARLARHAVGFILAYIAASVVSVGAWSLVGSAALDGRLESGTLVAWLLMLLGLVPLALTAMWSQGVFMLGVGGLLKLRLFSGALSLDPQTTRHDGVGHHLARVLGSDAVESMSLTGGLFAIAATLDLLIATILLVTLGQHLQLAVLSAMIACTLGLGLAFSRRRAAWTAARLELTHRLVDGMLGHRTVRIQDAAGTTRGDDDEAMERYVAVSSRMDRVFVLLAAIPRASLIAGLACVASVLVGDPSPIDLAISLGITLLTFGAFSKLIASITAIVDARIALRQVRPLLDALTPSSPVVQADSLTSSSEPASDDGPLVLARDITYQFAGRASPVLRGCTFRIDQGDRIHLAGASGGGKSTLVSLLTGLRAPGCGLLLLKGLDRGTLGTDGWRRRVAGAPQFHENHVFSDTLAFNLLMGRRWPPAQADLARAETVCRRLGLGDLLDRMPNGLFQLIGETGWQLSHGERSRLFMARAVLQDADLVVLDESFAELDPENYHRCLAEVAALSKTLVVVAHA